MKKLAIILCLSLMPLVSTNAFANTNQLKINTVKVLYKDMVYKDSEGTIRIDDSVLSRYADNQLRDALYVARHHGFKYPDDGRCDTSVDGTNWLWRSQDPYVKLSAMKYRVNHRGRVEVTLPQNPNKVEISLSCTNIGCEITDVFNDNVSMGADIYTSCVDY